MVDDDVRAAWSSRSALGISVVYCYDGVGTLRKVVLADYIIVETGNK